MPTETIISILIALAALIFTGLSYRRGAFQDVSSGSSERAKMVANIEYIRNSIDEIKLENRAIKKDLDDVKARIIVVEQSTAHAHQRLDDLKK